MSRSRLAPWKTLRQPVLVLSLLAATSVALACRSTPAPAKAPMSADTWAVVDGHQIMRAQVDKAYSRTADPSQSPSGEEILAAKLGILNDLIVQEILVAKAQGLKVQLTDTELDTAYAEAKKGNPDDAAFQQELTRRGLTAADMRESLRRDLITQRVIQQEVLAKIAVTDQEVADFFNANRARFNLPEEAYHIAQIAVTPVKDAQVANRTGDDAVTPQAATAKAGMLMERLKTGASFSELASDFSEDPESAPRGGDLGFVPVSRLRQAQPQLRDAVFKKAPGTVTVVSAGGNHTIVLVVAHEEAGQRDLTMPAVRDRITETLRGRKEQLLRVAYLTALRNDATVVNHLAKRLVESQGKLPSLAPVPPGS